ncbi:unnamed protein product [Phaedon cochleariae]|uniref:Uncharacterized protein n=1 Tax=Phaedon cochleariae TaxID=80249 RepID=A0A9N9X1S9_PHACE|nr:unnamed protein product [Phaedon cochleariae]
MKELILFLHAATGCDTTSAIFDIGKLKPFRRLSQDEALRLRVGVFNSPNATPDDIATAGEMFIMSLYPGKTSDDLGKRRFQMYVKINSRLPANKKFDLAQLPPTSSSSREHSLRVYLQVQEWLGNPLPPTDWGFEKDEEGHLRPVTNRRCESKKCSCRRHKMVCSNICGYCAGHGCSNTLREEDEDNVDHPDKDLEPIPCTETDVELISLA